MLEFLISQDVHGFSEALEVDDFALAKEADGVVYDNILRLSDDPDVNDVIKFLRQREIVHFQRFGEAMRSLTE